MTQTNKQKMQPTFWLAAGLLLALCAAPAKTQPIPRPRPCIYPYKESCVKHCYCAWCEAEGRCFEVSRFEKDMPPIVEAECGSANASYTTYMYSEYCERQTENIEASVRTLVELFWFLCGFGVVVALGLGFYGCWHLLRTRRDSGIHTGVNPHEIL